MSLGHGAGCDGDARLIGADQGDHLFLRDQTQRLILPGCRGSLVVGEYHFDLGAAEAWQTAALGERKILQLRVRVVDDLDGELDGSLRIVARACRIAAQGIDRPDLYGLLRYRVAHQGKSHEYGSQTDHSSHHHFLPSRVRPGRGDPSCSRRLLLSAPTMTCTRATGHNQRRMHGAEGRPIYAQLLVPASLV